MNPGQAGKLRARTSCSVRTGRLQFRAIGIAVDALFSGVLKTMHNIRYMTAQNLKFQTKGKRALTVNPKIVIALLQLGLHFTSLLLFTVDRCGSTGI